MRRYIIQGLCGWLVLLVACTAEEERIPIDGDGGSIALTARKEHLITKAGDEVYYFPEGTKYRIYAEEDGNWKLNGVEGTGAGGGLIELEGLGDPLTYGNNPLSFYGVTYATDEVPEVVRTDGSLTITETVADNRRLPDLMYSNNLKDQTAAANGYRLRMDFKHALCKLNFRIVKQDESEDLKEEQKLTNVTLKSIKVQGTHESGTFDIVEGTWRYTDEASYARTYYYNSTDGMPITTLNEDVPPDGGDFLIFPNEAGEEIVVAVTLGITGIAGDKTVEYPLRAVSETGKDEGVFRFQSNHQYTLVITVLKDDVRVVAIAPQVYDWVPVDNDDYLGQPVTFAGLMWMDRNLGAKSADCENDWEKCRGYYYQYGRNIPYILDMEQYELAVKGSSGYEFLYTYDQKGEKVYGGLTARSPDPLTDLVARYPNVAINPGDEGIYKFVSDISNGGVWLYDETSNIEYSGVNQFWTSSVENHPCPKGWRLPTAADFATFMPDITLSAPWNTTFHVPRHYTGAILKEPEEMVYGKINGESAIYLIKRQGKPDCYRIRILMKESNIPDKYYFEFAYFSGDENMTFMDLKTEEDFIESMSNGRFDWSTPSAIMQVPAVGFIHPSTAHKLDGDGENAILRTSEWKTSGTNWVCYLRNSWRFGLISESRKALGDQIRCVRDINADMY